VSARGLHAIADWLRREPSIDIELMTPPQEVIEVAPLRVLRLTPIAEGKICIRAESDVLEVRGGPEARHQLAETLINLALSAGDPAGAVVRHVDLEYFPGHYFLAEDSMWVTVVLLRNDGAATP